MSSRLFEGVVKLCCADFPGLKSMILPLTKATVRCQNIHIFPRHELHKCRIITLYAIKIIKQVSEVQAAPVAVKTQLSRRLEVSVSTFLSTDMTAVSKTKITRVSWLLSLASQSAEAKYTACTYCTNG